ncbi:MAG: hypothetical protein KDB27_00625, partial [Planctomycetales bacterium]|nr:hypothetical protein [Planctomycetales bacterium]
MLGTLTTRTKKSKAWFRSFEALIPAIRELATDLTSCEDVDLAERSAALSLQAIQSRSVDDVQIVVPALALVTEAVRRATAIRLHDEQLLAAMILSRGQIAEMQTGEGKTLVAIAAAYCHSLLRKGVHVATTNAYLAERDSTEAQSILSMLNTSVGYVRENASVTATRGAYNSDVTYATGYQFGFDYLRDQMASRDRSERPLGSDVLAALKGRDTEDSILRQRSLAMAIIDEADSVMIDEAMVPLVLSGQPVAQETDEAFRAAHRIAQLLTKDNDFSLDRDSNKVQLTPETHAKIQLEMESLNIRQLVRPWSRYIENALYAIHNLHKNVHYIVDDNNVQLVDQNTGRVFPDRTWRDGLHQAVETKEGVTIRPNDFATTRITRQRFFRLYDRVGGLTGTAVEARDELQHFYGLHVVEIPTHQPCRRKTIPTRFFSTTAAKHRAIAESVAIVHRTGQPVLVGTTTIKQSIEISRRLTALSVPHVILNGIQDRGEAEIISSAGKPRAVTVATNMAGRG